MNLDFFDFLLTLFGLIYICPLLLTNILSAISDVIQIGYKLARPISHQYHHTPENHIHNEESTVNSNVNPSQVISSKINLSTLNHTTIQARFNSKTPITPRTENMSTGGFS